MNLLDACKLAYRKHVLNDDSIGWDELGNCLLDAICNEIGDDGYQQWLQQVNSADTRKAQPSLKVCDFCLRSEIEVNDIRETKDDQGLMVCSDCEVKNNQSIQPTQTPCG